MTAIRWRAVTRSTPLGNNSSYRVCLWRIAATTAKVRALSSRFLPASVRPTQPLPLRAVRSAVSATSLAGHPGEQHGNLLDHLNGQFDILFADPKHVKTNSIPVLALPIIPSDMNTEAIVQNLDAEIRRLEKARALLTGHTVPLQRGVAPRVSAEGRARIATAQRKRWAAKKK
jgi:hypothetical protein